MQSRALVAIATTTVIGGFAVAAPAAMAGKPSANSTSTSCHKSCTTTTTPPPDTTAPGVGFGSPAAGSTVSGTTAISGSASDNVSVSRVDVQVDGGSWQAASGTTSWTFSWNTTTVADGSHNLTVRATDSSGNTTTAGRSFTVSNATTSSGGSTSGSTGGTTTTTTTTATTTSAPNTQGSWVSPEGVHINVNSAGPWTINKVYSMLIASARNLSTIGPLYTINVQDTQSSMTTVSYQTSSTGVNSNYHATTWLKGVSSTFASYPDYILTHEFGHAWTEYYWVMKHGAKWTSYNQMRLDGTTYNGQTFQYLSQDTRLGSSQTWQPAEIIADDYRLLFGSSASISQRPTGINSMIVDPRNQSGLSTWMLQQWAQ